MIDFDQIFVAYPEYNYFNDLSGTDKISYLIELYDLENRKTDFDPNERLADGLKQFFEDMAPEEYEELEFTSYDINETNERVDIMIDHENILIESNSLKAVRHILKKCVESGYLIKRDVETEKVFKKNKVGRYLRIYNIIGTENHICYS
tara:strand:- start:208 stop:654 length:447 start_codon:yes stop_codon:yes gene_type:complete